MLPESTTLSSWSVLSVEPGKSRTHGELDGERLDTSDLDPETLAEFVPTQESSLNDDLITTIQSKTSLLITLTHSLIIILLMKGIDKLAVFLQGLSTSVSFCLFVFVVWSLLLW